MLNDRPARGRESKESWTLVRAMSPRSTAQEIEWSFVYQLCDVNAQLGVERVHGERGDDVHAHERDQAGCVLSECGGRGGNRRCIR